MGRLASSIILCMCLLQVFVACDTGIGDIAAGDGPEFVSLDVSVALSDVSDSATRAGEADAADDNEKMQSLRIVIVRPDGTVEANRRINLKAVMDHEYESFKVAANERKAIYLFVNEDTEAVSAADNISRKVVDYDLGGIRIGQPFPESGLSELTIKLDSRVAQVAGPLPMSEKHYVDVPGKDHSCRLFVTRAAVKFTFHINNQSSGSISVDGLTIDKMAKEEWYLPRAEYEISEDGKITVSDYEVPLNRGDYTYGEEKFQDGLTVPERNGIVLPSIYLLEGKYSDPDGDERNYSMTLTVNDVRKKHYFPQLSTLPRNTHVVVYITVTDTELVWEADVLPYMVVELNPDFGLEVKS